MKKMKLLIKCLILGFLFAVQGFSQVYAQEGKNPSQVIIWEEGQDIPISNEPGINPHDFNNNEVSFKTGGKKTGGKKTGGNGDFMVSNFATGIAFNNFFWRGYAFRVSREVTVTDIWGGYGNTPSPCGASAFNGAIFSANMPGGELNSPNGTAPIVTPTGVLRSVQFSPGLTTDGEPLQRVALSSHLTLTPGQLYIIAQGSLDAGHTCHRASNQLDLNNLLIGSMIIAEWFPPVDRAYWFAGTGTPESRVGVNSANLDEHRVLVGFRYLTDVSPAVLADAQTNAVQIMGTNDVIMEGSLLNSGGNQAGDRAVLYFEYSTSSNFTGSTLTPAEPFEVMGPATDVPFSKRVNGLATGISYYYRAVAINESGRTNGQTKNFTLGSMPQGHLVTAIITENAQFGSVTPAQRAVPEGQTAQFLINTIDPFVIASVSGCGGTLTNNVYETEAIVAACAITIALADIPSPPFATAATNVGLWSFRANWNNSAGATGYLIDVATDDVFENILDGYNNLDVGNNNLQTLTNIGPYPQRYYYRLKAYNNGGESDHSNTIEVNLPAGDIINVMPTPNNQTVLIDVAYELYCYVGVGGIYNISAEYSLNGGSSWEEIPQEFLSGDITGIIPNNHSDNQSLMIHWDAQAHIPQQYSTQAQIRLNSVAVQE